ncbi:MAG: ATP-binding protein [Chthoniobacterales bacterium]
MESIKGRGKKSRGPVLLVLDEIQKVEGWSEVVKRLWDEEKASGGKLRVILLGSSSLLMQKGMTESLAGRFYLHRCMHWTFEECHHAFGWDLNKWFFFGGYPGPATLIHDETIWKNYINDSLIETVLARDVMQLQTVSKPILLRNLFGFATAFPAQIFSYNKMLGQLTDAENTTTLATYLKLLETVFLVSGLEKFSRGKVRQRGSSPKLILWNNALVNAFDQHSYQQMQQDPIWRGRLIENAVGASFLNSLTTSNQSLTYWRDGNNEVDFVLTIGQQIWAIEVKSGLPRKLSGLAAFKKAYLKAKSFLIGSHGVPLEEFFSKPALSWFS